MKRVLLLLPTLALALAAVCSPSRAADLQFNKSYAIVIGIDDYSGNSAYPSLRYAVKDATAVADFLAAQGFEVTRFLDRDARRDAIVEKCESLGKLMGKNDRFCFFFAGHGHTETFSTGSVRGYLVPFDGKGSSATYLSMTQVRDLAGEVLGAARHQLFILDCCFGGLLKTRSSNNHLNSEIPNYIQEVAKRQAREILTAGGADQRVQDGGTGGHSVFTAELLSALREGLADTDGNGYVTFLEMASFVQRAAARPNQTPGVDFLDGHQQGEFVFRNPKWVRPGQTPRVAADTPEVGPTRGPSAYELLKEGRRKFKAGDLAGAKLLLNDAATLGNAEAMFLLGVILFRLDHQTEAALKLVRDAANRGVMDAMKVLKDYYLQMGSLDSKEANRWEKEIAEAESLAAQTTLVDVNGQPSSTKKPDIPPEDLRLSAPTNLRVIGNQ